MHIQGVLIDAEISVERLMTLVVAIGDDTGTKLVESKRWASAVERAEKAIEEANNKINVGGSGLIIAVERFIFILRAFIRLKNNIEGERGDDGIKALERNLVSYEQWAN